MRDYLLFVILGLGAGAIYAGLGLGLVVQFKATNAINFAYGALAMLGAYMYDELRRTGDLVFPWVGLPYRLHIGARVPSLAAMALVILTVGALGLAVYLLLMRPLRHAPSLAKVVATVGLMLALQALVVIQYGTADRSPQPVLPAEPLNILGLDVPRDRLYLAAIIVVLGVCLWAFFRFSKFGLRTRAAAETERGAFVIGISPDMIGAVNWAGTSMLAALLGILVTPITGLDATSFILIMVPVLAAALIGRLSSLAGTATSGLVLGMMQSELIFLSTKAWFPSWGRTGAANAVPFVVIVAALFLVGRHLPQRGEPTGEPTLRSLRKPGSMRVIGIWTVGVIILLLLLQHGYRFALIESLVGTIVMFSVVILTGFLGQISLAQATFAGAGGFVLSRLVAGAHIPFPLAPLLAACCAALLGLIVGIPALRIRGLQLAVASLAGAVVIDDVLFNNQALTGGLSGSQIPEPHLFGLDIGPHAGGHFPSTIFGLVCLAIVVLIAVLIEHLRHSDSGRRMLAVRSDEAAAAAIGINVMKVKLGGIALASFVAGIGGAMSGYLLTQLSAASFSAQVSIEIMALAYLGGITSVSGGFVSGLLVAGGLASTFMDQVLHLGNYYFLLSGVAVAVAAVINPEGVASRASSQFTSLQHWLAVRRGLAGVPMAIELDAAPVASPIEGCPQLTTTRKAT